MFGVLLWLGLGVHVPVLWPLVPITTIGLAANIAFGYCPLARMMYFLPWNRAHELDWRLAIRVWTQTPGPGRFQLAGVAGRSNALTPAALRAK